MMSKKVEQPISFESLLQQLKQIICCLDNGVLCLKNVIDKIEQGIQVVYKNQKHLQQPDQRLRILLSNNQDAAFSFFMLRNN